tara:strand:- start:98 stop:508 length:411 start_codon:yes stop_codon:yes gene_type:complete
LVSSSLQTFADLLEAGALGIELGADLGRATRAPAIAEIEQVASRVLGVEQAAIFARGPLRGGAFLAAFGFQLERAARLVGRRRGEIILRTDIVPGALRCARSAFARGRVEQRAGFVVEQGSSGVTRCAGFVAFAGA